jgi:hypothetical protein
MTLDELDKLAAEKVMGWFLEGKIWESKNGVNNILEHEWCPTRNIAQAWELLGKIKKSGIKINISKGSDYKSDWEVTMDDGSHFWTYEGGAPIAITRACLAAIGVEIE